MHGLHNIPLACVPTKQKASLPRLAWPPPNGPRTLARCLLAKTNNAAAELLAEDVYEVEPSKTAMTPTDFFLYCLYGGMLAAGEDKSRMATPP